MVYRRFRILVSKGWTFIVCSLSIVTIALMGSCRSKKVNKSPEPEPDASAPKQAEVVDEYIATRAGANMYPSAIMPGDSKEVKGMVEEMNTIKDELNKRMNSVIYGTPEVMKRRAKENDAMRHKIDSLQNEITKARRK